MSALGHSRHSRYPGMSGSPPRADIWPMPAFMSTRPRNPYGSSRNIGRREIPLAPLERTGSGETGSTLQMLYVAGQMTQTPWGPLAERYAHGKRLRKKVPRERHARSEERRVGKEGT